MEYSVFSDESYISAERYRSIGALSFPKQYQDEITERLSTVLAKSGTAEFKWQKLKNAKYRYCANHLLDYLFEILHEKKLRIDVLIWDTQDSRHKIPGRDDYANFGRMFFHLMKNLMQRRKKGAQWYIYPDENFAIDWKTIQDCLASVGKWREYFENHLFGDTFSEQFFHIKEFKQIVSEETPCCQIADLFAGMSVYSKHCYEKLKIWCDENSPQGCLFQDEKKTSFSNKEKERFFIIDLFVRRCKSRSLGVSINTNRYLCTPNPNYPINFWHYTPQHSDDKAPIRIS